jgi:hypothetical protein
MTVAWSTARTPVEGEILEPEAALSHNVFHGNALAAALRKPGLPAMKSAAVLIGHRFVVGRGRSQGARDRIEQDELQEPYHSRNLCVW